MLLFDQLTESSIGAHKTLVKVLLTTLADSKNAEELNKNWARVSYFLILFLQQSTVSIS
jgi:type I restriction enzyme S subunit